MDSQVRAAPSLHNMRNVKRGDFLGAGASKTTSLGKFVLSVAMESVLGGPRPNEVASGEWPLTSQPRETREIMLTMAVTWD